MTESMAAYEDAEVRAFVERIREHRVPLTEQDRQAFDAMLLATARGTESDIQAYGFFAPGGQQLALAAVLALGIAGGMLGGPLAGTAAAAPLEQPTLNGNAGGGSSQGGSTGGSSGGHTAQQPTTQPRTQQPVGVTVSPRNGGDPTMPRQPQGPGTGYMDPLVAAVQGMQPLGAPLGPTTQQQRDVDLQRQLERAQDEIIRQAQQQQRDADLQRQLGRAQDEIIRQAERLQQARELAESMRRAEETQSQQAQARRQIPADVFSAGTLGRTPATVADADIYIAQVEAAQSQISGFRPVAGVEEQQRLDARWNALNAELANLRAAKQRLVDQSWAASDAARAQTAAAAAAAAAAEHRTSPEGIAEGAQAANAGAAGLSQPGSGNVVNRVRENSTPPSTGTTQPTRIQPGVDWTQ